MRALKYWGTTEKDLAKFPKRTRDQILLELEGVRMGDLPEDWRPMPSIGQGVIEIRVRERNSIYRTMYVAKYGNYVHVLHAFQKKTQQTEQKDIEKARSRLKLARAQHS